MLLERFEHFTVSYGMCCLLHIVHTVSKQAVACLVFVDVTLNVVPVSIESCMYTEWWNGFRMELQYVICVNKSHISVIVYAWTKVCMLSESGLVRPETHS